MAFSWKPSERRLTTHFHTPQTEEQKRVINLWWLRDKLEKWLFNTQQEAFIAPSCLAAVNERDIKVFVGQQHINFKVFFSKTQISPLYALKLVILINTHGKHNQLIFSASYLSPIQQVLPNISIPLYFPCPNYSHLIVFLAGFHDCLPTQGFTFLL